MVQNTNPEKGTLPDGVGRIIVQVYTADQTKPIDGAHVTITREKDGKEELIRALLTNPDGKTPAVDLPAPSKNYSLAPNEPQGFSNYNIRVDYPGYYTMEQINLPVFPGITSIQQINLIPLPLDVYTGKKKNFISEPYQLNERG